MKSYISTLFIATTSLIALSGCLDMDPVSTLTNSNMWTNEGQYTSFVYGVHSMMRDYDAHTFFILGELRSDIYSSESSGWTSESNHAEEITGNLLSEQRPGLTNYGDLYTNINQINLFISKAENTSLLSTSDRDYYLGMMYGLRAYYYFHLVRSWGDVVWQDQPSLGFEVGDLAKEAASSEEILSHVKSDIALSEAAFSSDYSFREGRTFWSKPATLMLKAEVYLWTSRQADGGIVDAQTAFDALNDLQSHTSDIGLMEHFADVFDYDQKGNREIIFALHNEENESQLFNGDWRDNMVPQQNTLNSFYASIQGDHFDLNFNGNIYYPISPAIFILFDEQDTRRDASLKAAYSLQADGTYQYEGCFAYKYRGMTREGDSYRTFADDYPIYRYADLLLLRAEALSIIGGDPSEDINRIRMRAYGECYDAITMSYGHMAGDEEGIDEVLLRERMKEFMFEGKRWYDLRRFGTKYVMKYSSLANQEHLLWPLDTNTLTDNPKLEQTKGYS